ncbi:EAL domain-containing protein [Frankia sp. Cppng1_Ct_nod]|uniref:putative bifunctional diguanylate cyclase/phosphodiesterase n=1 Tax=Frankia sp. Cppng1_Ct_nod TaxID=2897162 RepID=UPI001040F5C9|nr:EAL domain-containing protein [Frankia sp. Cppng1_Ct_nod]
MVAGVIGLVADAVSTGLLVVTFDGRVVWANRALLDLVLASGGSARVDLDVEPGPELGPDPVVAGRFAVAEAGLPLADVIVDADPREARWQAPDGTIRWLELHASALVNGGVGGVVVAGAGGFVLYEIADITGRHREEETTRLREQWLHHVETIARTGIWEWDLITDEVAWSDELLAMFGYPTDTYLDYETYRSLVHPDDVSMIESVLDRAIAEVGPFEFTHRMFLADRLSECVLECHGDVLTDDLGTPIRIMGTAHDVTELVGMRRDLARLDAYDPLTGLRNRRSTTALLSERLEGAGVESAGVGGDRTGALLLIDVDDFKDINELHGHAVGDMVLRALARALSETLDEVLPGAVLGWFGGDEFAVIVDSGDGPDGLAAADVLCETIARHPVLIDGVAVPVTTVPVTISVGVVPLAGVDNCDMALARADVALYEAKDAGRNRARLFAPEQREAAARRLSVTRRVRDALDGGLLALEAQPIVDLASREVQGYEVLVRLRDGRQPDLDPADFLGAVEDSDLRLNLDRWVLERTVAVLSSAAARRDRFRLHMNISGRSVEDPAFGDFVLATLRAARVDPSQLGLEIAEAAAMSSPDAVRHLAETLTGAGCRFILDGFGAGLGSFVHLRNMPFTNVKIAGDFLRNVDTSPADTVLADAVVRVARCLGMYTIAENVDREGLALALRDLGVDCAQGFHAGRPRPLEDLLADTSDVDPDTRQVSLNGFFGLPR